MNILKNIKKYFLIFFQISLIIKFLSKTKHEKISFKKRYKKYKKTSQTRTYAIFDSTIQILYQILFHISLADGLSKFTVAINEDKMVIPIKI
ncbi:MAG: hypothetical protein PHH70_00450 [Candidatus Gracilibacteria bacterium]|nr:hypothetical protein [Candidatus Gracilibacteria bacterium]